MKKAISIVLCLVLALTVFAACGKKTPQTPVNDDTSEAKQLQIVSTIFPQYDWLRQITKGNDKVDLQMLVSSGVDLHSYQPSAEDLTKVANCDMFVYVGGESDEWVENALENAVNKDMIVVNLLEVLGDKVKAEEVKEGMEAEDEEEHEHHHEEIEAEDIEDRGLADFAGSWKSLYPYLQNGDLDTFFEHEAEEEEDGTTAAEIKAERSELWQCDSDKITIDGDTITFTDKDGNSVSAAYSYAGYQALTGEDGDITGVRYQFETADENAPKYVQFNDHGYQPGEAEHFHIYYGSESFDALTSSKQNPFFVNESLSVEEIMEELEEHGHEEELDEHVWLSLQNAVLLVDDLKTKLGTLDPDNKALYEDNAAAYTEELKALDRKYQDAVKAGSKDTLVFADRFPFRYLVDDYGLDYYAAFVGCSAESEASFETIAFLANKIDELGLTKIMQIESADGSISRTVKETTKSKDQTVLTLDSLQSVTKQDVADGLSYLSAMEQNLAVLTEALT